MSNNWYILMHIIQQGLLSGQTMSTGGQEMVKLTNSEAEQAFVAIRKYYVPGRYLHQVPLANLKALQAKNLV